MKESIFCAAAVVAFAVTIGFVPARATPMPPKLEAPTASAVIPVHCRRTYHCRWDADDRVKRCHVCG